MAWTWIILGFLLSLLAIPWAHIMARVVTLAIIRTIEEERKE